jgi:phenylalanyl-tRNA synthetase beta chain
MNVTRAWLQKYFDAELPSVAELADALTVHAFEIESAEGDLLDVKVLPDRACYALSVRGIASELSAILTLPLKEDPLTNAVPAFPSTDALTLSIEDSLRVPRYMAAKVSGVKVGPSPTWLKEALESAGQRSINNVVDATNYVMLSLGQPLHAFDAAKMSAHIAVRSAKQDEKITILGGTELALPAGALVIADGESGVPLGIAGVKGGQAAELTAATTDLIVESANFDPVAVRKTAQALKLFTDASLRFQNRVPAELAAYGMQAVLTLITAIAGGEVVGVVDAYASQGERAPVAVSLRALSDRLGRAYTSEEVEGVFKRLQLPFEEVGGEYRIMPPFWRKDLVIPEDIAEEVGRIIGYDAVPATPLPPASSAPDQRQFAGIERVKDFLIERGFTELSTPSFAAEGDIELANPLQSEKPFLRSHLKGNMKEALVRAITLAPRVLGPVHDVRLFEVGTVFTKEGEKLALAVGYAPVIGKKQLVLADIADELADILGSDIAPADDILELTLDPKRMEMIGEGYTPVPYQLEKFRPFSLYPFALRDVAVWTPSGTEEDEVANLIMKEAGELLARIDLFDRFEKEERISYAFRLVFESFEKTLADTDLDPLMARVTAALNAKEEWQVR